MITRELSYSEMKQEIFDYLAKHFEDTGTTTNVSVDDVVLALGQKPIRAKRALESLLKENMLIPDESEQGSYRLSPTAYIELVQQLKISGRLPKPINDEDENSGWIKEGHAFISPVETPISSSEINQTTKGRLRSENIAQALQAKAAALKLKLIEFDGVNEINLPIALEALDHAKNSLDKSGDKSAITQQSETGITIVVHRID